MIHVDVSDVSVHGDERAKNECVICQFHLKIFKYRVALYSGLL